MKLNKKIQIHLGNTYAEFIYKNHRGEIAKRRVILTTLWFGESNLQYYQGDKWFIDAKDIDKDAYRTFALENIQ